MASRRAKVSSTTVTMAQRMPTRIMGEISPAATRAATTLPPQTKELMTSSSQGLRAMREGRNLREGASLMGQRLNHSAMVTPPITRKSAIA